MRPAEYRFPYLHIQPLSLLNEGRWYGKKHDVGVEITRAVIWMVALDAQRVVLLDDGRDHIEPSEAGRWTAKAKKAFVKYDTEPLIQTLTEATCHQ